MRCQFLPGGVIVCGARPKLRSCSTPGCRGKGSRACDFPITRPVEKEPSPKRGDCRLHREHRLLFFVWASDGEHLTISQTDPGNALRPGTVQTITKARWFEASDPTCDRPVCPKCVVTVDGLDLCGVHGRELAARTEAT